MFVKLMDIFGTKTRALEVLAVFNGIKPVARIGFYADELQEVKGFCEKNNLSIQFSDFKVLLTDKYKGYSDKGLKVSMDDQNEGMIFTYISKDATKSIQAKHFEEEGDMYSLGLALGYPMCCVEFFVNNYSVRSKLDNDYTEPSFYNSKMGSYSFVNNTLLKDKDMTLLFHFPCSFHCSESEKLGKQHFELLKNANSEIADSYEHRLKNWFEVCGKTVEFD